MLNLASYRYRRILSESGGPVEHLETTAVDLLDRRLFLANATLRPGLAAAKDPGGLYGSAHGSGVDASPMVARFKALSESMERWAHWQLQASAERAQYGFDVDPSTNGLAAFPGLWARQARRFAWAEATERFNLLHWWEGRLPALDGATRWPGVRAVTICSAMPGLTVILYKQTAAGWVYGQAAAMNHDDACWQAAVEMERHEMVIGSLAPAHAGGERGRLPASAHPIERRCLFFASPEGHELFLERVRSSPGVARARPRLVYDGPVPGPWSRYADVWRVVYEPPNRRFLGDEESYFYL
jgi:hypothetical protein